MTESAIINTWHRFLTQSIDRRRIPDMRQAFVLLGLTGAGIVGNYFNTEIFFGVNLIFGSIATMVAIRISGVFWGALIGIIIGSYTYLLWGHPYAIIIFGAEALFMGVLVWNLKKENMVLIDAFFWVFVGIPLIWIFYTYQLGLPENAVKIIMLKQTLNGLANTLLASLLMQFGLGAFLMGKEKMSDCPLHVGLNNTISAFILIPMLLVITMANKNEFHDIEMTLDNLTQNWATHVASMFDESFREHALLVKTLVSGPLAENPRESWASKIDRWRRTGLAPELVELEITDSKGVIEFAYPVNRTGYSNYAEQIRGAGTELYSLINFPVDEIQVGYPTRSEIDLVIPLADRRYLVTSLSLKTLINRLGYLHGQYLNIILEDGSGNTIISEMSLDSNDYVYGDNPHHLLPADEDMPAMVRWRQAYWESSAKLNLNSTWQIKVRMSMASAIDRLQEDYSKNLLAPLLTMIIALLIVPIISKRLVNPLLKLTNASAKLAENPDRDDVDWPVTHISEIKTLVNQYKKMIQTISNKQIKLQQSEDRFSALAAAAPVSIYLKDLDGRYQFISQAFRKWHNIEGEITHKTAYDIFTKEDADIYIAQDRQIIESKITMEWEAVVPCAQGTKMAIHIVKFPIFGPDGELAGIGGIDTDISERKEAAAQIIQASKLATLGEMATGVAHELNQPLNVIRMAAGNVLRKIHKGNADSKYLSDKLERISAQTERAASIIGHMRMFGRKALEANSPICPCGVIQGALDMMGEQLRLLEIDIKTDKLEDCRNIIGHQIQLEQVIINLLSNAQYAIQYRDGLNERWIRLAVETLGSDRVKIIVEDSGGGIPDNIIDRIFEPFYTTKEMGKGTGLGLSVSYGIIRDMGGSIVASNTDQGARFEITLPSVDALVVA